VETSSFVTISERQAKSDQKCTICKHFWIAACSRCSRVVQAARYRHLSNVRLGRHNFPTFALLIKLRFLERLGPLIYSRHTVLYKCVVTGRLTPQVSRLHFQSFGLGHQAQNLGPGTESFFSLGLDLKYRVLNPSLILNHDTFVLLYKCTC